MSSLQRTVSGTTFDPFNTESMGTVDIGDIAWSLAHQCRYNGHVDRFYSVANHCLVMSRFFSKMGENRLALEALLHDAAEAYTGDIIYPIKKMLPDVVALENRIQGFILSELGHDEMTEVRNGVRLYVMSDRVNKLDKAMIPHETSILRTSVTNKGYNKEIGDLYDMPPDMLAGMFEVAYETLVDKVYD